MTIDTDKRGSGHRDARAGREQGRRRPRMLAVATVALVPSAALAGPPPACSYTVTVIESPLMCGSTPEKTAAKVINANGLVAGERYCVADSRRAFFWSADGGYQPLDGPPEAYDMTVHGLNNRSEMAGEAPILSLLQTRGYLRRSTGQYEILSTGPTGNLSEALDLNDASTVVGYWANIVVGPGAVPCKWQDGVMTDLSTILGFPLGRAHAVNSHGQITGWIGMTAPQIDGLAFILDGDRVTVLPPIPGGITSEGYAINARGDLAGIGRFASPAGARHALAYIDGQMLDLGLLPGTNKSSAASLNNHQVVVGESSQKAFVWQDSVMRNLNDLIPPQPVYNLKIAHSIDDDGVIVVSGSLGFPANGARGFVLTPVYPSPADLSGDCQVDGVDLALLLGAWGAVKPGADASADLNHDGVVSGIDLAFLLGEWG